MSENWIRICAADEIDEEDVKRFDHDGKTYCIYNTPEGFFATDGLCTHEDQHLSDGFVFDTVIECPLHQGSFDIRTGEALTAPVCINLKTWPVKVEAGTIFLGVGDKT